MSSCFVVRSHKRTEESACWVIRILPSGWNATRRIIWLPRHGSSWDFPVVRSQILVAPLLAIAARKTAFRTDGGGLWRFVHLEVWSDRQASHHVVDLNRVVAAHGGDPALFCTQMRAQNLPILHTQLKQTRTMLQCVCDAHTVFPFAFGIAFVQRKASVKRRTAMKLLPWSISVMPILDVELHDLLTLFFGTRLGPGKCFPELKIVHRHRNEKARQQEDANRGQTRDQRPTPTPTGHAPQRAYGPSDELVRRPGNRRKSSASSSALA